MLNWKRVLLGASGVLLLGANEDCNPEAAFVQPTQDAVVSGEVLVVVDARDDVEVAGVIVEIDKKQELKLSKVGELWEGTWMTQGANEGLHELTAVATDSAGQTGTDTIQVTVDNIPDPPPPLGGNFGGTIEGLGVVDTLTFLLGALQFAEEFDGVGPTFNDRTCASCHSEPVQGGSSGITENHASAFSESGACDELTDEGGFVFQVKAIEGLSPEVIPTQATGIGRRTTSPVHGLGLVNAIADNTLLDAEDPGNTGGVSGKAHVLPDGRVGKFGRKANFASLLDFTHAAFIQEQGLTTSRFPEENTINGRPIPPGSDEASDPEVDDDIVERVATYMSFFQPPPRDEITGEALRGWALFIGDTASGGADCAACHTPSMQTADDADLNDVHRNKTVWLFSDLLLHDMVGDPDVVDSVGADPNDNDICIGEANPDEFRTELLMGLRERQQYLHDGSAPDLRTAIMAHAGEAEASASAFLALSDEDQAALIAFLMRI